jgi:hypothetical protein
VQNTVQENDLVITSKWAMTVRHVMGNIEFELWMYHASMWQNPE